MYIAQKTKVTESTLDTYSRSDTLFFAFFKEEDKCIADLTKDQMIAWKESLLEQYAEASVAMILSKAKVVFNWAVEKKYIEESPLKGVDKGSFENKKNDREITMAEYYKLLDVAVCQEWRVIFALARIGGLRAPSEVLKVRWSKVDWAKNRFTFPDSKRKDKEGNPYERTVPLFPALRVELEALWERDREMNPEFVINRYRDPKTNLGTEFARAAKAAGLGKIVRPFDNMRASRSTEIIKRSNPNIESAWIGHSTETARKHYWMVMEHDYADAAQWDF